MLLRAHRVLTRIVERVYPYYTTFLKTVYVLIFIELGTRRVHLAGVTIHPDGQWVAQQARQLIGQFEEMDTYFRCLIRDNDTKYTSALDTVY